jgi:hypothetical protein
MTTESEQLAGFGKLEDGLTGSCIFTRWVHPEDWLPTSEG